MAPSPPRWRVRRLAGALALAPLLLAISPGEKSAPVHEDAVPSSRPGFEPVDVSEETQEIRRREVQKMEQQVDADAYYRRVTSEDRMRARYGSATWNLYDTWH